MAYTKRLEASGIKAHGTKPPGIRVDLGITAGPAGTAGHTVQVRLTDGDVESIFTYLLERDEWRRASPVARQ